MNLTLSDEQTMLRESAQRFVRDTSGVGVSGVDGFWQQFADLGWLALPLPDAYGGLAGTPLDVAILLEEFGRGLLVTPYVDTVVLGAGLVAALGSDAQKSAILGGVATGKHRLAFANGEPGPRGVVRLATTATMDAGQWRVNGRKIAVIDGSGADTLLVSAQVGAEMALFLVPRASDGVSILAYPALGGGSGSTVVFEEVILEADARLGAGDVATAIETQADVAIAALCAEAVGIMAALLDATVAYTGTREQFGKPLNANQTVRFKLADMAVAVEEARSMALRAALNLGAPPFERIRAVAGAKAKIGRGARLVAELAIQLHGAMGVTEELAIGGYYKRALAIEATFGGTDEQLIRHARASGRLAPQLEAA